jgi:hypothetical protein
MPLTSAIILLVHSRIPSGENREKRDGRNMSIFKVSTTEDGVSRFG